MEHAQPCETVCTRVESWFVPLGDWFELEEREGFSEADGVFSGLTETFTGVGCVLKTGTWQSSSDRESGISIPLPMHINRNLSPPEQFGNSFGQTDNKAPFTSPIVSAGLHSRWTAKPSRLANINRRITLSGSYLYGGRFFAWSCQDCRTRFFCFWFFSRSLRCCWWRFLFVLLYRTIFSVFLIAFFKCFRSLPLRILISGWLIHYSWPDWTRPVTVIGFKCIEQALQLCKRMEQTPNSLL